MRTLVAAVLVIVLVPVAVAEGQSSSSAPIYAVGDPITMHRQAIVEISRMTGTEATRLATAEDAVERTAELSRHTNPDGARTVYLASNHAFADALAAAPLLRGESTGLLLTDPTRLDTPVRDELARLDPEQVVVLGGVAAVSSHVVEAVRGLGPAVTRIAGPIDMRPPPQ